MATRIVTLQTLVLLMTSPMIGPIFGQPAPQRSADLCEALRSSASESGRKFAMTKPGACMMNIDAGYDFGVDYDENTLFLFLSIEGGLPAEAYEAYWLRLSAFDNLAHVALGTELQGVFKNANALVEELANKPERGRVIRGNAQKAKLGVMVLANAPLIAIVASAGADDIDKMQRNLKKTANRGMSTWRKILSASLLAFSAGAEGYVDAHNRNLALKQQSERRERMKTCYTNFIGDTVFTNCD